MMFMMSQMDYCNIIFPEETLTDTASTLPSRCPFRLVSFSSTNKLTMASPIFRTISKLLKYGMKKIFTVWPLVSSLTTLKLFQSPGCWFCCVPSAWNILLNLANKNTLELPPQFSKRKKRKKEKKRKVLTSKNQLCNVSYPYNEGQKPHAHLTDRKSTWQNSIQSLHNKNTQQIPF